MPSVVTLPRRRAVAAAVEALSQTARPELVDSPVCCQMDLDG